MIGFKGTPGPWEVSMTDLHGEPAEYARIRPVSGEMFGHLTCLEIATMSVMASGEQKVNAILIAEAPALLYSAQLALSIAESWILDQLEGTSDLESAMQSLDPVRATIAKALGEE